LLSQAFLANYLDLVFLYVLAVILWAVLDEEFLNSRQIGSIVAFVVRISFNLVGFCG